MKFKTLTYETATRGDFGPKIKQDWDKWKDYEVRRMSQYKVDTDDNALKIVNHVHDHGYVVVRNFFDKNLLKKLNDETQYYIQHGLFQKSMAGAGVGPEHEIRDKYLWSVIDQPILNVASFIDVAFHDDLIVLAANYFGCMPYFGTCNLRKSFINDMPEDHTQIYHQDPNSPNFIKMFLYLNDVDEKGGPFCIVRDSHKNKFENCYDKYRWTTDEIESIYGSENIHYLTANVGDLIIANTTAFHRGTKPESMDRTMVTLDWVMHPEFFSTPEFKISNSQFNTLPQWKRPVLDYLVKVN
jgi:hypothetical protein